MYNKCKHDFKFRILFRDWCAAWQVIDSFGSRLFYFQLTWKQKFQNTDAWIRLQRFVSFEKMEIDGDCFGHVRLTGATHVHTGYVNDTNGGDPSINRLHSVLCCISNRVQAISWAI